MSRTRKHKWPRRALMGLLVVLVVLAALASWVQWGDWPVPTHKAFARPEAVVILGGGDPARWNHGYQFAKEHPDLPLIVTGDGNLIVEFLMQKGIPRERIIHETSATSTVENAKFTKPLLDQLAAVRVLLVTNWFHVPRTRAIFRKYQPGREFGISFPPKPEPMMEWDRFAQRRERLAALHNLLLHGVWSW